jgi:mannosyltransferase OCH1-like enzyme
MAWPAPPAAADHAIPRHLFRIGPASARAELAALFDAIQVQNPTYTLLYYDDAQALAFLQAHFPFAVRAYERLVPGAYKADLLRYCLLYQYGGVYGDLTQTYLLPLDQLIAHETDTLVLCRDRPLRSGRRYLEGIQISFMAARPRLEIFQRAIHCVIANVRSSFYGYTPQHPTGPTLFRECLDASTDVSPDIRFQEIGGHLTEPERDHRVVVCTKAPQHTRYVPKTYGALWRSRQIYRS